MKKFTRTFMSIVLAITACFSTFACKKPTDNIIQDGKTINVRAFLAGYGVDWLYQLKDKFEKAYEKEGYKVNILNPSNSVQTTVVVNELYNGGNGVDLYFPGSVWVHNVTEGSEFGRNLVEDLTDTVYSKPAIGFDGKEESVTVREKMKKDAATYYNVYYNNREYGFAGGDSPCGLAVNQDRLDYFGFDLPRTTDELMTIFDSVMLGKNADGEYVNGTKEESLPSQTGIYPHTFYGGVSGYPVSMYQTWMAQYMGKERWTEFNSYERASDPDYFKTKGYEIYADQSIYEMLEVLYQMFDKSYATRGSTSQDADAANYKMIDPDFGAIFFSTASWMINEVKGNYPEESKALRMINYPVISAVGTKAFGAGTTANITNEKKCDKVLSEVVRLVDENKTNAEIVEALRAAEFNVITTEADVAIVREARLMYCTRADGAGALITKDSPVKDIAALFLRMYASDDFSDLYYECTGATTLFDKNPVREGGYKFGQDCARYANREDAIILTGITPTGLRRKVGHLTTILYSDSYIQLKITTENHTKWVLQGNDFVINGKAGNEVYAAAAKDAFDKNAEYMKDNWSGWMAKA